MNADDFDVVLSKQFESLRQEIFDASNRITKAILFSGVVQAHPNETPNDILADVLFWMQRIGR